MKTNEWQNIESVFHLALSLDKEEREKYLAQICSGNQRLRGEIESLIASFEERSDFLEQPAFDLGMEVLQNDLEISLSGQQIGVYKILEKLGSGGMGEVYLAEDTRLNRKVALKFLSKALVDNRWAKRQLVKEAQAVAMLDHPNICSVYDIEEIGEHSFIVMQYIQGETLSNLIRSRSNSIDQSFIDEDKMLSIAQQITNAIAAAHAQGIIHRDIKAGNIMITPGGQVKVLDFGLAKIIKQQKNENFGESLSLISQNGLVVGTVAYMSPEQLRAEKLDYRTDIFSLGTVFYELLSGKHPFLQKSNAETISAILTMQPEPIANLKNGNSAALYPLIKKCLEKDKEKRFQSAGELDLELRNLQEKSSSGLKPPLYFRLLIASLFVAVLLIIAPIIYRYATSPRSLAVLPFVNQSADPENDYLSRMTETLIDEISNSSQLRVTPVTKVQNYKAADFDPVEIGKALNVEAVLTGRIIKRNNQVILETRLINIADGSQLWGESNVLQESDALIIQNKISEKVISELQSPITRNNQKTPHARNPENPAAFKYYLQGLNYWKKRDKENIEKAIEAFNQAISIDPNNARAHSGLANSYMVRTSVNYKAMPPKEAIKLARSYAEDAIKIDENLSEGHAALGAVLHKYDWNWTEAEKKYRRAIELDNQVADTYYWYSQLLSATGYFDEALANIRKAQELDSASPLMDLQAGRILYYARRFDEAEKQINDALKKYPNEAKLKLALGFVYLQKGKHDEALKIFEEIYASDKSYTASLGYAYGKAGKQAEALGILNEIEETAKKEFMPAHERVLVYIGLNDKDNAFFWLEKAYQERFIGLPALNVEPAYDNLRDDARFQDLIARMNLNQTF